MDLVALLRSEEGKTLEFKRSLASPDGVLRTIVAFANGAGGTVLIGVEDRSRTVCGVAEPVALEARLANMIVDRIEPRLLPEIEILPWRRMHVVAVQVFPSPNRPHYLSSEGPERGIYVRIGSTNRRADDALVREIQRSTRFESFDEEPIPELDSEAIDFRAASESFEPIRRLNRSDLETLRLVTTYRNRLVPTVGGLLLFGRDRLAHFPDAWLQVGRFAGTDKSHIVDHAELKGSLVSAVERAIEFVQGHMRRSAGIGAVRRTDHWELPPLAVREAIINAVAHADYSQQGAPIRLALFDDRLEVENPGLLPFGLLVEDLYRGVSKLRNRVIGRVFHELGLIEQWGSGVQRMISACRQSGLSDPILEEIGMRFRVTIWGERSRTLKLDDLDRMIVTFLESGEGRSTSEIAAHVGRTPRATRTRLAALIDAGLIREIGTGPQDPKRRYYRSGA